MSRYSYPFIYGTKDHHQLVIENTISYFNELGEKLVKARETGTKITMVDGDPIHTFSMRQVGRSISVLDSNFSCGKEYQICKALYGEKEKYNYHWYFSSIYETLCAELIVEWNHISYDDVILNKAESIQKRNDVGRNEYNETTLVGNLVAEVHIPNERFTILGNLDVGIKEILVNNKPCPQFAVGRK